MRERRLPVSLSLFAALVVASLTTMTDHDARASVATAATLDELALRSTLIARVTPLDHESTWENGRIVTYSRVRVDAVVAGALPAGAPAAQELRVRTLGGRVGNIGQLVEGEATLAAGGPSIVFLESFGTDVAARRSVTIVVGRAQGQLLVRRDTHGREIVRIGAVGELVEQRVRPPLRPGSRRVVDLDGAAAELVAIDVKRAWEAGHAH